MRSARPVERLQRAISSVTIFSTVPWNAPASSDNVLPRKIDHDSVWAPGYCQTTVRFRPPSKMTVAVWLISSTVQRRAPTLGIIAIQDVDCRLSAWSRNTQLRRVEVDAVPILDDAEGSPFRKLVFRKRLLGSRDDVGQPDAGPKGKTKQNGDEKSKHRYAEKPRDKELREAEFHGKNVAGRPTPLASPPTHRPPDDPCG